MKTTSEAKTIEEKRTFLVEKFEEVKTIEDVKLLIIDILCGIADNINDIECKIEEHKDKIEYNESRIEEANDERIDKFYARLLEDFKKNFKDENEYRGKYVKLHIDNLIKRIK